MPDTILVPVDVSRFGEWAIPVALGLARATDAQVELALVFEEEPVIARVPPLTTEEAEKRLGEYLQTLQNHIAKSSSVPVASTLLRGDVAKSLEAHARKTAPTLIVMSTHGRGPLSRAWLGSVADRVVRHVPMPVLLVRPQEDDKPQLTDAQGFQHILIALDGSERAEQSVTWATKIGRAMGATYTVLRVVPAPMPLASPYLPHAVKERQQALEHGREEATRYIEDMAARLRADGLAVEADVLVDVPPASGIVREAEERGVDLIVIATHGRRAVSRAILGSVADKVIRAADAPVLVIRSSD